jgi:hypothetical protein
MQKKDNAPCSNQPKELKKNGTPEEANFLKKQVSLIPQVPPTKKNRKQQNSPSLLKPIHSQ